MVTTTAPTRPRRARNTTVALKASMAVTGVIFVLFVLLHMYGNLKAFAGQEAFDGYAASLRTLLYPYLPHEGFLWIQRVVLVVALVVHFYAAVTLWARARAARRTRYVMHKRQVQTYSSRTMRWGGLIILAFVIFHLLQFTTLTINVGGTFDSPYQRLVAAFRRSGTSTSPTWWPSSCSPCTCGTACGAPRRPWARTTGAASVASTSPPTSWPACSWSGSWRPRRPSCSAS